MPRITRWFLKTGLIYLVIGLAAGMFPRLAGPLFPVYVHFITIGWLTQLIFGVAFWLFPQSRRGAKPDERPLWAVYALLNAGLIVRAVAEPATQLPGREWAIAFAAASLWAACCLFAAVTWPRIRPR